MKRLLIALLCLAGPLHAKDPSPAHNDLHTFIELAKTCKASAENSTDAEAIKTYSAVSKIARNGGKRLQLCHLLDDAEAEELCTEIATGMEKLSPPKRQVAVVQHTPRQAPSLRATVSTFKKEHEDTLLKPTPLQRRVARIALKTAVELLHDMMTPKKPKKVLVPDVRQRLSDMGAGKFPDYAFKAAAKYAVIRTATDALIDEFLPAGILSQSQKLTELAAPPIIAGILHAQLIKRGYGHLTNQDNPDNVIFSGVLKGGITRPLLTRLCLDRSHPLYKWVNLLACVAPFFMGPTAKKVGKLGVLKSWNNVGNAAIDGGIAMAVYDGAPALVDLILRKVTTSRQLNPKHRRKMIRKFVRDPLSIAASEWMAASFVS